MAAGGPTRRAGVWGSLCRILLVSCAVLMLRGAAGLQERSPRPAFAATGHRVAPRSRPRLAACWRQRGIYIYADAPALGRLSLRPCGLPTAPPLPLGASRHSTAEGADAANADGVGVGEGDAELLDAAQTASEDAGSGVSSALGVGQAHPPGSCAPLSAWPARCGTTADLTMCAALSFTALSRCALRAASNATRSPAQGHSRQCQVPAGNGPIRSRARAGRCRPGPRARGASCLPHAQGDECHVLD